MSGGMLAVHSGAVGDVILFGRLLERLDGPVTLAARGARGRLLAALGVVERAMDFDSLATEAVFGAGGRAELLSRQLGAFERLVSCFAAGDPDAEDRLGELAGAREAHFLPVRPPGDAPPGHLVEFWSAALGVPFDPAPPAWEVPERLRSDGAEALGNAGIDPDRSYAVIHPGAGSKRKCWLLERFEQLADRLALPALFLLGPAEMDWWGARAAALRARRAVLAEAPLETLAGVLGGCSLYVGNDSGVSHLAGVVGAKTLALFGPTDPDRFAPLGPHVRTLRATLAELPVGEAADAAAAMGNAR